MLRVPSRLAPLALALVLVACQDNNPTAPQRNTTRLGTGAGFTLLLTDAPNADITAAVVTISRITMQGTGGSVTLMNQPFTGNLLDLQNEVATLVRGADVPAGSYSQLRLVLSGAYIRAVTPTGTKIFASSPDYAGLNGLHADGTLQMPSMGQSGLKIDLPGGKLDVGADETIVMIDFDVANSFGHEAGNSGRWVMHPVVKATNVTFGGNVLAELQLGQGVTLPMLNGQQLTLGAFAAVLTPAGGGTPETIPLTLTNGVFSALFKGLVPGNYTLTFVGPAGLLTTFAPTLPITVTVLQKMTTTEVVTLSSAVLPGSVTATLALGTGVTLPSVGNPPVAVTLADFKAQLTPPGAGATPIVVSFANVNGTFQAVFPNLAPGTYSLTVLSPTGTTATYTPTVPVAVNVVAGTNATEALVVHTITAP